MMYIELLVMLCAVIGLVGVAANPTPVYGAMGLVIGAAMGCAVLVGLGGSFVALILFLIYLGGMLVVFAYSVALAADSHPEAWVNRAVVYYVLGFVMVGAGLLFWVGEEAFFSGLGVSGVDYRGLGSLRVDVGGVVLFYSEGGGVLVLCGLGLVLSLFVVVELTRGLARGGLRVV